MLYPLSWDEDNWRSIFHTWMIYYHALSIVMGWWQLTEHVSYMNDMHLCSDRCHETMTTEGACFIHKWYIPCSDPCKATTTTNGASFIPYGWINMLWPLSRDDDNWRSMTHPLLIYNHALSVVIGRWQLTEHVSYMNDILPCSDRRQETMTTEWAWFIL